MSTYKFSEEAQIRSLPVFFLSVILSGGSARDSSLDVTMNEVSSWSEYAKYVSPTQVSLANDFKSAMRCSLCV